MNNSKSGLVGILSFLALTAASLGLLGVASHTASARSVSPAASGVVRDGGEPSVESVTVIPEITVTPAPKLHVAAKRAASAAPSAAPMRCTARDLEQGGTFRSDLSSGMSDVVIVCS